MLIECLAPEKLLLPAHRKADAGLVGRVVGSDVCSPHAISLLDSQRVDRAISPGHQTVWLPGLPEGRPQDRAVLDGAVQLVPELTHICDAKRAGRNIGDRDLTRGHVWKRLVRERLRGERG